MIDILFDIVYIFSICFEALIIYTFYGAVFDGKLVKKNTSIVAYIGYIAVLSTVHFLVDDMLITMAIVFVCAMLLSFLYKSSMARQVISVVVQCLMVLFAEFVVGLLMSIALQITVGVVIDNIVYFTAGTLISKLVAYCAVKIFASRYRQAGANSSNKRSILFAVFPIVTFLIGVVIIGILGVDTSTALATMGVVAIMLLVFANVTVFYLFDAYTSQLAADHKRETNEMLILQERHHLESLISSQYQADKARHDFNNQLYGIRDSFAVGYDDGMKHIEQTLDVATAHSKMIYTHMPAIDALISDKVGLMQDNNIKLKCSSFLSQLTDINVLDLCIIIGNLLDNAIEASIQCDSASDIHLNMVSVANTINLQVSNSYANSIVKKNGKIITTKHDSARHGYGLASVEELVHKYDGRISIDTADNRFVVDIVITV